MNICKIIVVSLLLSSCITTTKNELPDLSGTTVVTTKKINLVFNNNLSTQQTREIYQAFVDAGFEKNIYSEFQLPIFFKESGSIKEFRDFFPVRNLELFDADIDITVTWESAGFFEPYCVIFLTAIPCTPPYNWTIGFRVLDKRTKLTKDYIVQDRFVLIYWLGFLTPSGWKKGSKVDPLLANAVKNLMLQLKQDNLI